MICRGHRGLPPGAALVPCQTERVTVPIAESDRRILRREGGQLIYDVTRPSLVVWNLSNLQIFVQPEASPPRGRRAIRLMTSN